MKETGSVTIVVEASDRLHHLHVSHSSWLKSAAYNITKDREESNDLISELYVYLLEKPNSSIFYSTSYNLMYCRSYLYSRFINKVKKKKETVRLSSHYDIVDKDYDEEFDDRFEKCWEQMLMELDRMKKEPGWSSVMLFEHYFFSDKTLEEVSEMIGISKSTTFMNTKKVKMLLRELLQNPFTPTD
jgi:RNA polymerase sigma factor (sigma-70 family)